MKCPLTILFFVLLSSEAWAQSAENSFHVASNQYIQGKMQEAKSTLESALKQYPNDPKLNELKSKIKEDEKKEQQDQNKQDQDKKDQDQKNKEEQKKEEEKEKKDQQQEEEKKKEEKEKKEEQNPEQKKEDQKKDQPRLDQKKLEQMKISEEKAKMILDAMKHQEVQYLQQNKRKATKPKDKGKPDW